MARPARRHARKASATTAEEILLPAELMHGLTSSLSSRPAFGAPAAPTTDAHSTTATTAAATATDSPADCRSLHASDPAAVPTPDLSCLDLAPLFPGLDLESDALAADAAAALATGPPISGTLDNYASSAALLTNTNAEQTGEHDDGLLVPPGHPDKGILKPPKKDENTTSRWSLWPGAKKWFTGASLISASGLDMSPTHATFDLGAGIPAASIPADDSLLLSRTAPSLDFERSTNHVPPLSQERIKSTEFWSNFALELDPSKLKRIRFSMPLIVTEFDPETSHVYDPRNDPLSPIDTNSAVIWDAPRSPVDPATPALSDTPLHGSDKYPATALHSLAELAEEEEEEDGRDNDDNGDDINEPGTSAAARTSTESRVSDASGYGHTASIGAPPSPRQSRPIQWNIEALTNRKYRVQEVWELYERTCRSLDIDPLPSFEKILMAHMRKEQTLGGLDLAGTRLDGTHMKCFADMLDLNFGLVKLELSYCDIDDDAVRLLVYSMLCNDSVRYLSLAHNPRLHSDGVRCVSILVRHSKQLQMLDLTGVPIQKKSAGYLAAALTGLGANWSLGRGSMHKKPTACEQISLQALRLNCCGIKPAALAILASGVRLSPLQHLSLRSNSLTASAGPILREMLYGDPPQLSQYRQPLTPRRPISVSLHGLSDAQHCGESLSALQPANAGGYFNELPRVSRLRSLDLSQNDLGRGVLDLAEGLLWNTNLRSLVLRQNKLQPAVFAPFAECLGINKGLVYLDISRNPVCGPSTAVVETLTQVLTHNRALRGLFMSASGMTSEGAITLAECLPELNCLERLDVSENPGIDVAGLMALSASIKLNKSLICVEVTVNTGDEVCAALEQGIAQTCIANMQRLDTAAGAQSSGSDFSLGLVSTHVWPHADMAPESNLPGVVSTKISGEADRSEFTSLVTDIAAVKRPHVDSAEPENDLDGYFGTANAARADLDSISDFASPRRAASDNDDMLRAPLVIPAELEDD